MTEAEWLACTDPQKMLESLQGKATSRKLRLFSVACCRCIWHLLGDGRSRAAVEITERYADDQASKGEIKKAYSLAWQGVREADSGMARKAAWAAAQSVYGRIQATAAVARYINELADRPDEPGYGCSVLRCIFGNPFRRVTVDPSWLTWNNGTVTKLAQAIYDDRAFDRLPVLAAALEEAGCHNADILNHCRQPGLHARGCWVLDLLLDKK